MGRRSNRSGIVNGKMVSVIGMRKVICEFRPRRAASHIRVGKAGRGVVAAFRKVAFSSHKAALVTKNKVICC